MSELKFAFDEVVEDIIYVDGRLSKAKTLGVAIFSLFIFANMIFTFPQMLRINTLLFVSAVVVVFLIALLYYAICRGIGFLARKFLK